MTTATSYTTIRQHYLTSFDPPLSGMWFQYYEIPNRGLPQRILLVARRALMWLGKFCAALTLANISLFGARAANIIRSRRIPSRAVPWQNLIGANAICTSGIAIIDILLTARCKRTRMWTGLTCEALMSSIALLPHAKLNSSQPFWVAFCVRCASIAAASLNFNRAAMLVHEDP